MAYQTITKTSYGTRLKDSTGGIITGFLLLIAGTVLLFWNEGRTAKTYKMLKEAQKVYVEIPDISSVDPSAYGKLVHATGLATTDEILTDGLFGISLNAIRITREVEYYQWVEHTSTETRDKVGGGQETITTYTYSTEWTNRPVSSQSFEDPQYRGIANNVLMTADNMTTQARNVTFGAYRLPDDMVSQMSDTRPLNVELSEETIARYNQQLSRYYTSVPAGVSLIHQSGNVVYLGQNSSNPDVGDVRITYTKVLPGQVSILAQVNGDTFEPYTAKNGYTLMSLYDGTHSAENMFASEKSSNKTMGWLLRILGILIIYLGFKSIFEIIVTLLKVLPFLATIADLGVSLACFALTAVWSLLVIGIGWLFYRPVIGIIFIAAAVAAIWYFAKKGKQKKAAAQATAPPTPSSTPEE